MSARGFTLIEIVLTAGLAALLAGVIAAGLLRAGAPSQAAAQLAAAAVREAAALADARNAPARFAFDQEGRRFAVVSMDEATGAWRAASIDALPGGARFDAMASRTHGAMTLSESSPGNAEPWLHCEFSPDGALAGRSALLALKDAQGNRVSGILIRMNGSVERIEMEP